MRECFVRENDEVCVTETETRRITERETCFVGLVALALAFFASIDVFLLLVVGGKRVNGWTIPFVSHGPPTSNRERLA